MGRIEDFMRCTEEGEFFNDIPDMFKIDDDCCTFKRNDNHVFIERLKEHCWTAMNITQDDRQYDLLKGGFVERTDPKILPLNHLNINEYLQFKTVDDAYDYLMDNFPELRNKDI